MDNWTLEKLESATIGESTELFAQGWWSTSLELFDVNYSNIQTRLIQEAGRWCELYASDILYDLKEVERELNSPDLEKSTHFFGFRAYGVDHTNFILSRLNGGFPKETYRAVWKLEIQVEDERCIMELCRIIL